VPPIYLTHLAKRKKKYREQEKGEMKPQELYRGSVQQVCKGTSGEAEDD